MPIHAHRAWSSIAVVALLTACASPATDLRAQAEPGSSIQVTGPAGGALKLGQTARFVAVFKAPDGTNVFGKSFVWTSLNPDVAAVDANGRVTAKRLGVFRLSASSEGISGTSDAQYTYGLEVVGGSFNEGAVNLGAAILVRLRGPNGQPPATNTPISVSGPEGFNGNSAVLGTYRAGRSFDWTVSRVPPVRGVYTVTATVSGELLEGRFEGSFASTLEPPTSLDVIASGTRIDATWSAVTNAKGYAAVVWRRSGNTLERLLEQYTTGTSITFNLASQALEIGAAYVLTVFPSSSPFDDTAPGFGVSFDTSLKAREFVPAPPSPRLNAFLGRWQSKTPTRIAQLDINASGTDAILEAREACTRPDCTWAPTRGLVYWASPEPSADAPAQAITAVFSSATTRTTVLVQATGTGTAQQLTLTILTEFTDGSGRQPFVQTEVLERG